MTQFVLVLVFAATGQMGYKFYQTEAECYKDAVVATAKAKKLKVPVGWKCFKEDDPAYSAIMKQIRAHQREGSI